MVVSSKDGLGLEEVSSHCAPDPEDAPGSGWRETHRWAEAGADACLFALQQEERLCVGKLRFAARIDVGGR